MYTRHKGTGVFRRDCACLHLVCACPCTDLHKIILGVTYYLMRVSIELNEDPIFCCEFIPLFVTLYNLELKSLGIFTANFQRIFNLDL